MKNLFLLSVLFIGFQLLSTACSSDANTNETTTFDRQEFLAFMLNEQILPAATNLDSKAAELNTIVAALNSTPTSQQITATREAWIALANAWQQMHIFDFGASELPTGNLGEEIATFPVSETKIQTYLGNEDYSFQNFDRDTRGIYAIEYFLFAESANLEDPKQLAYLKALVNRVTEQTSTINGNWNGSGKDDFLAQNGTDAGSSLSDLVNAMAKSYEAIKNFKLGVPLGLRPGQVSAEPSRVEAYYSDQSLNLLQNHFIAISNIWKGEANFSDRSGLGFEEYLESVFGGPELKTETTAALSEIEQKITQIGAQNSLKNAITANQNEVIELHNLFQRHTRLFKSDLASLLGVSITFNSGDGD